MHKLTIIILSAILAACGGGEVEKDDGKPWIQATTYAPTIGTQLQLPAPAASAPGNDGGF